MRHLPLCAVPILLAACATTPEGMDPAEAPAAPARCDAAAVQSLIGQRATAELGARLLAASGARQLRWGPPDSAMTMDYREDRLNVFYDRAMVIERITCG